VADAVKAQSPNIERPDRVVIVPGDRIRINRAFINEALAAVRRGEDCVIVQSCQRVNIEADGGTEVFLTARKEG